jgi:hypothetical protein
MLHDVRKEPHVLCLQRTLGSTVLRHPLVMMQTHASSMRYAVLGNDVWGREREERVKQSTIVAWEAHDKIVEELGQCYCRWEGEGRTAALPRWRIWVCQEANFTTTEGGMVKWFPGKERQLLLGVWPICMNNRLSHECYWHSYPHVTEEVAEMQRNKESYVSTYGYQVLISRFTAKSACWKSEIFSHLTIQPSST